MWGRHQDTNFIDEAAEKINGVVWSFFWDTRIWSGISHSEVIFFVCVCTRRADDGILGVPKGIPAHRSFPVTQWFLKFTHSSLLELKHWICCSVAKSCLTVFDPMDCSMPCFPVHHHLPEFSQIHVQWLSDNIQSLHPLSSPSPPAFNLSQHQGLFQWANSSHQVAKVLELQL